MAGAFCLNLVTLYRTFTLLAQVKFWVCKWNKARMDKYFKSVSMLNLVFVVYQACNCHLMKYGKILM